MNWQSWAIFSVWFAMAGSLLYVGASAQSIFGTLVFLLGLALLVLWVYVGVKLLRTFWWESSKG